MYLTEILLDAFLDTRRHTEMLCAPLETEDYVVQPTEEVSPPKWHLGHTTWFFEEFILKPHAREYTFFDKDFSFVFNSYYETFGNRVVRANRGNLSRPSVKRIYAYRQHVTEAVQELFEHTADASLWSLLEIGINHEQQHQELLLTDIKYILGHNPLLPAYSENIKEHPVAESKEQWFAFPAGISEIGHEGNGFCFDNELGRHKVYLEPFEIAANLVTNQEYMGFIKDGGYTRFDLWHAAGWDWVKQQKIKNPLYWHLIKDQWYNYTLNGLHPIDPDAPVTHISYYEAFAYAQWKGMRLPTEFEWETAHSHFLWGLRWEWTESAYLPYPKFKKAEGALGEYNGKFMVNQKVLRGASIATPAGHSRPTYRNFFHPHERWQYTGFRLAR
ncbi:ergothioneine biosynthesis protein EgtB [Lentiprolixibacter aurantiacus]